jgi:hypothetical protein
MRSAASSKPPLNFNVRPMNHRGPKVVAVDVSKWSDASRRLLAFRSTPKVYEDLPYRCRSCGREDVFTAEQQKHAYEIKKNLWPLQQHVLCSLCFSDWQKLLSEAEALKQLWEADSSRLKGDIAALERWLAVLKLLPKYGTRIDGARVRMLEGLIKNAA